MAREIIVVDSSKTMRRILSGMILANLNDVRVLEAESEDEVMRLLAVRTSHLIVFCVEMDSWEYASLAAKLAQDPPEERVPMLLVLTPYSTEYAKQIAATGIGPESIVPLKEDDIVAAINWLINPLQMRQSKRYSISRTHAIIGQKDFSFHAAVINISFGGILCDMEYSPDYHWDAPTEVTVSFEAGGEGREAAEITAVVSRLQVSESNPDCTPALIRVAYRFTDLSAAARDVMAEIFDRTDREMEELRRQG